MSRACAGWSFGSDQHSLALHIEVECVPGEFTNFLQSFTRCVIGGVGTQAVGQVSIDESLNDRRIRGHAFCIGHGRSRCRSWIFRWAISEALFQVLPQLCDAKLSVHDVARCRRTSPKVTLPHWET